MSVWNWICYLVFLLFTIPNCRQHPLSWLRWPTLPCKQEIHTFLWSLLPVSSAMFASSYIALKITKGCYRLSMPLTCDGVPQSQLAWRMDAGILEFCFLYATLRNSRLLSDFLVIPLLAQSPFKPIFGGGHNNKKRIKGNRTK